ncbi:MAG: hypothetical protein ABEH43_04690, partial [Flavobacteriales bacterium]
KGTRQAGIEVQMEAKTPQKGRKTQKTTGHCQRGTRTARVDHMEYYRGIGPGNRFRPYHPQPPQGDSQAKTGGG